MWTMDGNLLRLPTLYKKTSTSKIQIWNIAVRAEPDNTATIITWHGQQGGAQVESPYHVKEGKNVGKKNATTPHQQALSEAESDWKKKQDKGYRLDAGTATETVVLPMLAMDYKKRGHDIVFPCAAQYKLDGIRCLAKASDASLTSRGNKPFVGLPHIQTEISALRAKFDLPDGVYFDGELYSHELTLQEIASIVKQEKEVHPDHEKIGLRIYDMFDLDDMDLTYRERWAWLTTHILACQFLTTVLTEEVKDDAEVQAFHGKAVAEGYEGAMLRNWCGAYKLKDRSKDLQKVKAFLEDEFEIIGAKEANGLDAGTVVWQCKTTDGISFDVRPKGTREFRARCWKDRASIIGKKLTVRFQTWTPPPNSVPFHLRGICIRDYE